MMAKVITVFGGSGFLGRHVVQALAHHGYRLRVAVRRPHLAAHLGPMGDVGQIQVTQANIRHPDSVARALEGADMAVNLVGILYETGRQKFEAIHVKGAQNIALQAREQGVGRIVHLSALGADTKAPSRYAVSKAVGEAAVTQAFTGTDIIRPSLIFGPEDQFFNKFAGLSRFSPCLPLIGGGNTRFQPVYAGDVAQAIVQLLTQTPGAPRLFELGGPAVYTFKGLMQFMCRTIHRRRALVPVPYALAKIQAAFLGLLPRPLLTMDQVNMLKMDSVVDDQNPAIATLDSLGLQPACIETIVPAYLARFRPHGQYDAFYAR